MKVCAVVAEYNPLHLGHLKQIEYVKNVLKAEKIIVIMSGNFTQRGEPAILDKFTRSKLALLAGADLVIELPTVFACNNAEVFAKGAINILNGLNVVDGICFGVESGSAENYIALASLLTSESKEFKKELKAQLDTGVSFAKARFNAVKTLYKEFDDKLLSSPNNILGLEYTKAILQSKSSIEIYPLIRTGDHNDTTLKKGITSATSIRETIKLGKKSKVKKSVPKFVYKELKPYPILIEQMLLSAVITADAKEMSDILDCTEGLENRIKALIKDNLYYNTLVEKVSTKRYTLARVRRILVNNLLKIYNPLVKACLNDKLYAKILAVKSESKSIVSEISKKATIPVLTRKSDCETLKKTALACYEKDVLANDLYNLATGEKHNEHQMIIL